MLTAATAFDPPRATAPRAPTWSSNAIDGDTTTAWTTEQYDNFPDGEKNGVGLAFSLDREYDVTKVIVDTQQDGWGASIYVSDQSPSEPHDPRRLGDGAGQRLRPRRERTPFEFDGVKGQSVLLWLTQLPAGRTTAARPSTTST